MIPDPSNPQAWNRFGYVHNNPINFNDPSGHELCDADGDCNAGKVINNRREKGSGVKLPKHERRQVGDDSCSYHLCSNTNLYELGWENFGQAWNIWTSPNATYGQQWLAGAYMSYWGGAHAALIAGLLLMGTESTLLAMFNNAGISIGFDYASASLSGQEYTAERAFVTGSFSLFMGGASSGITKMIGTNTLKSTLINHGIQSLLQVFGNSTFRFVTGQPNTPATFMTDIASGGYSTIIQTGLPGNPNALGYYGQAAASLFQSVAPYATSDLQDWP